MNALNNSKESEETIFLQAIDQNYEINKNYSDFSEDDSYDDLKNGDIKINFDFIDFSDEIFIKTESALKQSEGNLSNSTLSNESTETESFFVSRTRITKFLTETKDNLKITDFLSKKFQGNFNSNKNLKEEIFRIRKDTSLSVENYNENLNKSTRSRISENLNFSNINYNNINNTGINNFNINYNYNFPTQQNINCQNYCGVALSRNNMNLNMMYNNFQYGFFQQNQMINNTMNIKIDSNLLGTNIRRKNTYPASKNNN